MPFDHSGLSEPAAGFSFTLYFRLATVTAWLNKLNLPQAQKNTAQSNRNKAEAWWQNQPSAAVDTIQRVAIMSGVPISLLQKNFDLIN